MDIQGLPPSLTTTLSVTSARLPVPSLQLGQTLLAQVVKVMANGGVTLNINNTAIQAKADIALAAGQILRLKVVETGLQTVLKAEIPPRETEVLAQALRQALPRQAPLKPLMSELRNLIRQAEGRETTSQPQPPTTPAKTPAGSTPAARLSGIAKGVAPDPQQTTAAKEAPPPLPKAPANASKPSTPTTATIKPAPTTEAATTGRNSASSTKSVTIDTARLPAPRPQPGQQLTAQIIAVKKEGTVTLNINNTTVPAKTAAPLTTAQTVQLKVATSDAQTTILKIESPPADVAKQQTQSIQPAALHTLIANIGSSARPPEHAPLPLQLMQLARELLRGLPTAQDVTKPEGLKRAIMSSGLFFENRLAGALRDNPAQSRIQDLKAALHRLAAGLKGQSGDTKAAELLHQTDGALARVQTNQLTSLHAAEDGKQLWVMELPVRNGEDTDVVQFRLQREPRRGDKDGKPGFAITLSFDIGELGPMHARIHVLDQQVSVGLWAEKSATVALVNDNLTDLGERLENAGLNLGNLACQKGSPNMDDALPLPQGLLDIQA